MSKRKIICEFFTPVFTTVFGELNNVLVMTDNQVIEQLFHWMEREEARLAVERKNNTLFVL